MYTKKKYSKQDLLRWTRRELIFFVIYASLLTILFELFELQWLRLPWTPLALIGTAVAFLIGFQNNAAYGRIWEARQIWGGIVNDSRTFGIMVLDMITNEYMKDPKDEEYLEGQKKIIIHRHVAWLTALRHSMRGERQWESFKHAKVNQEWIEMMHIPEWIHSLEEELEPVLSKQELDHVMSKTNKPATLLKLQSNHLRKLKEEGVIWEFSFLELESKISELMTHQGKSERIKNFPYPRQFATLGYDFVNMFIFLLPLGIVPEFSKIGLGMIEDYPFVGQLFVWLGVPFSALISWVFNTMQRIGVTGENPFEGSANDVPISTIARGIEIDLREMLGESKEEIPEQFPVVYDIQM